MAVAVVAVVRSVVVMAVVKAVAMEVVVTEVVELAAAKPAVVETVMVVAAMVEAVMAREDEERAAERPSRARVKCVADENLASELATARSRVARKSPCWTSRAKQPKEIGPVDRGARKRAGSRRVAKLHHSSSIYSPMMTREAN